MKEKANGSESMEREAECASESRLAGAERTVLRRTDSLAKRFLMTTFVGLLLVSNIGIVQAAESLEKVLGRVPIQQGGRVKPFASFAKESVLFITAKTSFDHQDPTTLVWHWMAEPSVWNAKPILPVTYLELRKQFASDLIHNRIAPALVLSDLEFKKQVSAAQIKQETEKSASPLEKKQIELYQRARFFEEIANARMPGFVPHPNDPKIAWLPLEAFMDQQGIHVAAQLYPQSEVERLASALRLLLDRLKSEKAGEAMIAAESFAQNLGHLLASQDMILDKRAMDMEFFYLKLRPFQLAWILYLISIFIWLAPNKKKKVELFAFGIFSLAFFVHTFGFVLRIIIAGRPPVTNMYESIIWVSWASAFFSLIFWFFYRSTLLPAIAASVATFALIIGESFPTFLDPSISPLVPVLRSNYWLTIHVLTITLGYGAFLFNWGIAHALLYCSAFHKKKETIDRLTEYLYRSLQVGVILLASGTILGGVWAAESWGRFWGWDPKETWALIAVLAYLAVLHSRTAGWLGAFGVAFWSVISFLTVLMAWYGVNFVLGAGLHSYGFGGGGLPYILAFVLSDVCLVLWLAQRFKLKPSHH
ncbi:MAG: cytochrome c biogenesis protein CcsA [Candidatus Omnitrophica bacterium]|nr:cytochrome c biogenesis protein CcsA [Candidatus Omnitrophota bacterium]